MKDNKEREKERKREREGEIKRKRKERCILMYIVKEGPLNCGQHWRSYIFGHLVR